MFEENFLNKKGYLQISFAWIFAIIVGIFIIFLAIYGVIKFINIENTSQDLQLGKEIGILTNPLETSFESSKSTKMSLPSQTRIYNRCDNEDYFGNSGFQISQKSLNSWTTRSETVKFQNKYIFSNEIIEGKNFYLFSKKLEFPFKVADLIYITPVSEEYCFIGASEDVEGELIELGQENFYFEGNCSEKDIKVCFDSTSNCNISVNEVGNFVQKNGEKMYFENQAFMFAAIFSEKDIYECQIQRLGKRISMLADIYNEKANIVARENCNTQFNLARLSNLDETLGDSSDLSILNLIVEDIKNSEYSTNCKLW